MITREELNANCERQIEQFERVEKIMPVTPNDWKRYEEHKLVLELLEQEPCDDAISRECNNCAYYADGANDEACDGCFADEYEHPNFKPKAQYCDDCVSRQAVLDIVNNPLNIRLDEIIKKLPPVIPERPKGEWIDEVNDFGEIRAFHCSECYEKTGFFTNCKSRFCPNCGADMRVGE